MNIHQGCCPRSCFPPELLFLLSQTFFFSKKPLLDSSTPKLLGDKTGHLCGSHRTPRAIFARSANRVMEGGGASSLFLKTSW